MTHPTLPKIALLLGLSLLLPVVCAAQTNQVVLLTFEGLSDTEGVLNYYNGGYGSLGSGPGPNYGITFGSDALTLTATSYGGQGNFSGNPSGHNVVFFLNGPGVIMNVPGGFTTGFSFYYAAANTPGSVYVYDGLNGTGNLLATLDLSVNGSTCGTTTYSCWSNTGVSFAGTAKSVNFSGVANYIGFDNITLGSRVAAKLAVTTTSPPKGKVGTAYSYTLGATGGVTPYSWSASGLPSGLSVNATSGVLSGTPTTAGTYSVTVTVTDSSSPILTATATFQLVIDPVTLTITTTGLPPGKVGVAYGYSLAATGGTTPYTWSALGLPAGLGLGASSGLLGGSPTIAGTFNVSVTVTDVSSPQLTATATFTLVIGAPAFTITTTSLAGGRVGEAYSSGVSATGGATAYSWSATGLPAGLGINASSGVVSGTPTASGTFSVTVTATDASSPKLTATANFSLVIAVANLTITASCSNVAVVGVSYSCTLSASGGTAPYTWSATGLPSGFSITTSGVISGTPVSAGVSTIALTVTDSTTPKASATQSFTFTVGLPLAPPLQVTPSVTSIPSITTQPTVTVGLSSAATTDLTVTLALTFTPNASNLGSSFTNQGLAFGGGVTTKLVISKGATSASLPAANAIQVGSVAGTVTATITSITQVVGGATQPMTLPSPAPSTTIVVPKIAPVITAVKIINVTSTGFTVDIVASSTPRDLSSVTFSFTAASGTQLTGTTFTLSGTTLTNAATAWFAGSSGLSAGGAFDLQAPFTFSGSSSAIGSVSVQLTNSAGTSTSMSGTM
jgi:hypothetical protein